MQLKLTFQNLVVLLLFFKHTLKQIPTILSIQFSYEGFLQECEKWQCKLRDFTLLRLVWWLCLVICTLPGCHLPWEKWAEAKCKAQWVVLSTCTCVATTRIKARGTQHPRELSPLPLPPTPQEATQQNGFVLPEFKLFINRMIPCISFVSGSFPSTKDFWDSSMHCPL